MTEWRGSGVSEASEVTKQARDGESIAHKAVEIMGTEGIPSHRSFKTGV